MTDQEHKLEASEQIRLLADMACPPDIEDQLIWILERARLATTWAAGTVYRHGQVVRPTTDNGWWYTCAMGGTSAATEPIWGICYGQRNWSTWDGSLIWRAIPAQPNIYDIRAAVHEAFMLKAAKASHLVDVGVGGGVNMSTSQMQKQFVERAMQFLPIQIAT